jgi:hypothetical protein
VWGVRKVINELITENLRKLRSLLFVTASASALALATPGGDAAEFSGPEPPNTWWLSLEGTYSLWGNELDLAWGYQDEACSGTCEPELGSLNGGPLDLNGWGGAVAFGRRPNGSPIDLVLRGRFEQTDEESVSGTWLGQYGPNDSIEALVDGGEATYRERHVAVDFEAGREVSLGASDIPLLRLHAGIRIAHLDGKTNFETHTWEGWETEDPGEEPGCYPGNSNPNEAAMHEACSAEGDIQRSFTGAGPRIGFDAGFSIGVDGFGLNVSGAFAALFGERVTDWEFAEWEHFKDEPSYSNSEFVVVPNFDGSLTLAWGLNAYSQLALGYRADAYFDVMDVGWKGTDAGTDFSAEVNRIIHGPFLSWVLNFK